MTGCTSLGSAHSPDPASPSPPQQPGLRSARSSESRCSRPVACRKALGLGVPGFPYQPGPPTDLCTRSPGSQSADTQRTQRPRRKRGGSAGRPLDNQPSARGSLYTPRLWQIITQFGEGKEIKSRREPSLPRKHFFCRHVLDSLLPPAKGACSSDPDLGGGVRNLQLEVPRAPPWRIRGSSFSTKGWTAPGPYCVRTPPALNFSTLKRWKPGGEAGFAQGVGGGGGKPLFLIFPGA